MRAPGPRRTGGLLRSLWQNKWWWLAPAGLVLVLLGGLVLFSQTSAFAPFIYTLR